MTRLILHVDDDPKLPEGVTEALGDGYEWIHSSDPEVVMRLVETRRPALVVMEVELARCDGPDLLGGIRSHDVPVLVLTHLPRDSGVHGEAIALGIVDFLSKPVLASDLLANIREVAPPPAPAPAPSAAAAPSPAAATPRAKPAADLSGEIGEVPVPELLARLRRRAASGVLRLHGRDARVGVQLRNGTPICVASNRRNPSSITDDAESYLIGTFAWANGSWEFFTGTRLNSDTSLELEEDPAALMLRGVVQLSAPELVRERLLKRSTLFVSAAEPCTASDGMALTAQQETILEELAGGDSVADLLDSNAFEEPVLYGLWVSGRIDFRTAPTLELTAVDGDSAPVDPGPSDPGPVSVDSREGDPQSPPLDAGRGDVEMEESEHTDVQSDAARALEAERWFRKGKGHLNKRRYEEAVEAFGMASHLDPEEGEYLGHLGYALFLSKPGEDIVQREAMEHIANGIKRSPTRELSYVYLGRIFKAREDSEAALKLFQRALRARPGCHAALQEIRLLEKRKSKARGLLARFLKR